MPGLDAVGISPKEFCSSSWGRIFSGITPIFGGREGAVVGSEVFDKGSCEGPGSDGEHVSGLVGDDGPVEGPRGIGKAGGGALARGEVVDDTGVDDEVEVLVVSGDDGDTCKGGDDVVAPRSTGIGSARRVLGLKGAGGT